jgi:enoyl-CoA hydratase
MKTNIILSIEDKIAEILLSPDGVGFPPVIDYGFFGELERHLIILEERREEISAVLLKSSDAGHFAIGVHPDIVRKLTKETIAFWAERGYAVFNRLEKLPIPVIAIVTGKALGGGLELALACDYILASDTALFGHPEAVFGFVPAWGGCQRLPERIGWPRAKELFYTGRAIGAPEAYRIGLINFYGTQKELAAYIRAMLEELRNNSPLAIRLAKQIACSIMEGKRQHGVFAESIASELCLATADTVRRFVEYIPEKYKKPNTTD